MSSNMLAHSCSAQFEEGNDEYKYTNDLRLALVAGGC
jgi:hypothetical protein